MNSPVSFTKVAYSFRDPANAATNLYLLRFTASLSVLASETIVLCVASSPANGSFKGRGSSPSIPISEDMFACVASCFFLRSSFISLA